MAAVAARVRFGTGAAVPLGVKASFGESGHRSETAVRQVGLGGALALVVGSMLGVGIFLAPPVVARHSQSLTDFYVWWGLGALTALAGGVACAELGALLPESGGDVAYQRRALGDSVAFASGMVLFLAVFSGSIAMLAVALSDYQLPVLLRDRFESSSLFSPAVATVVIIFLTALNVAGISLSARTQIVLTLLPFVALLLVSVLVSMGTLGDGVVEHGSVPRAGSDASHDAGADQSKPVGVFGFVVAYEAVYFAYSGWNNLIYVGGEVRAPGRTFPVALLGGTGLVTLLYLFVVGALLHVLGLTGLREVGEAGSAVASLVFGEIGRVTLAALVALAIVASINATIVGGARIACSLARGTRAAPLVALDARGQPTRALFLQGAWAILLSWSGAFELLLEAVSIAMLVSGSLTVLSLFVLRRTMAEVPRPYRATGYPVLPALYLMANFVVLIAAGYRAYDAGDVRPLLGVGVALLAWGAHHAATRIPWRRS